MNEMSKADDQLFVEMDNSNAFNIYNIKKMRHGSAVFSDNLLKGAGYWWGATPKGMPDATEGGFAQASVCDISSKVNSNVEKSETFLKLNWYQDVTVYNNKDLSVGIDSWGSITLPFNASIISVWNKFLVLTKRYPHFPDHFLKFRFF